MLLSSDKMRAHITNYVDPRSCRFITFETLKQLPVINPFSWPMTYAAQRSALSSLDELWTDSSQEKAAPSYAPRRCYRSPSPWQIIAHAPPTTRRSMWNNVNCVTFPLTADPKSSDVKTMGTFLIYSGQQANWHCFSIGCLPQSEGSLHRCVCYRDRIIDVEVD